MDGIILLYKEKGVTSFQAVSELKKKLLLNKIGHSGTLDPMAEGLLIALINNATKVNEYINYEKEYEIEIKFGIQTNTDDMEGEIINTAPVPDNIWQKIKNILPHFKGTIKQVPPAYSAIKKNGKKYYEMARAGQEFEIEPRKVTINSIDLISAENDRAMLRVRCAGGTYMRALARDIGEKLDSVATLSYIKRTRIGNFSANDAKKISEIDALEGHLIPLAEAIYDMPAVLMDKDDYSKIKNGNPIDNKMNLKEGTTVKMIYNGNVIAIGEVGTGWVKVIRGI